VASRLRILAPNIRYTCKLNARNGGVKMSHKIWEGGSGIWQYWWDDTPYVKGYKDGRDARQNMFEDAIRNRIAKLEKYSALLERVIAIYERHEERERAGRGSTKFLENWPSGHGTLEVEG
jgi:hypothetical protein